MPKRTAEELAELQREFPWVLEGFDIEDHSWHGIDGQACARGAAE